MRNNQNLTSLTASTFLIGYFFEIERAFLEVIALRNDYLKKLYYTASAVKKIQILRGQETEAHLAKALWAFYLPDWQWAHITRIYICYYERKADIP